MTDEFRPHLYSLGGSALVLALSPQVWQPCDTLTSNMRSRSEPRRRYRPQILMRKRERFSDQNQHVNQWDILDVSSRNHMYAFYLCLSQESDRNNQFKSESYTVRLSHYPRDQQSHTIIHLFHIPTRCLLSRPTQSFYSTLQTQRHYYTNEPLHLSCRSYLKQEKINIHSLKHTDALQL